MDQGLTRSGSPYRAHYCERMIRRLAALGVVAALGLVAGCTTQPEAQDAAMLPAETTAAVTTELQQTLEKYGAPGGVVAVCVPGYQEWSVAEGVADTETDTAMTTDLVWPLRSITKSFTVTLLLQLADEGKLSLDDPISKYVPDVPNGDRITLRQLADMTSGVPEYTTDALVEDMSKDSAQAFTTEELIAYALAEPAQFPPGKKAVYVNTSTLLLGEVVEEVTGQPFDQVLSERILVPLGLTATRYVTTPDDWSGPHATGYQPGDKGKLQASFNNFTLLGPAGAMTSTLPDLCRWGRALGAGEMVSEQTQMERREGQPLDSGPEYDEYDVGMGELAGWIGHTGEGLGYTVLTMYNPDTGAVVAIGMNISNAKHHPPTRLMRAIAPVLDEVPPATS